MIHTILAKAPFNQVEHPPPWVGLSSFILHHVNSPSDTMTSVPEKHISQAVPNKAKHIANFCAFAIPFQLQQHLRVLPHHVLGCSQNHTSLRVTRLGWLLQECK